MAGRVDDLKRKALYRLYNVMTGRLEKKRKPYRRINYKKTEGGGNKSVYPGVCGGSPYLVPINN